MIWDFEKPKLITRGTATKEKLWSFKPPIEEEEEELWDLAPLKVEPELPQLQDIAKIMPKAEEAKKTMGLEYVPAKVYSVLAEKPLYATGEFSAKLLKMGFNAIGLKKIGEFFEKSEEIWKQPPVTEKVQQQTAYLRQQSYKRSFTEGIIFDVTEATTQLMGLLTQMVVAKKIPSFSGNDIYTHIKAMATHAVVTTPGSLEERTQAALYRIGYSITPFIVNNLGATGLTAVATDTLLNTFLTSPTYAKALKQSDNIQEFLQIAIPQLVMDIGMAWNTRGLPANQRDAMINRYIKTQSRKMGVTIDEYKKIIDIAEKIETKVEVEPAIKPELKPEVEVKPEKLITPEGTVTGEKGSIFIPSMAEVQNIGTKIASKLSIEAPFIKAGAKETGFQVKNYFGNIGLSHEQGLKEINVLNKFNLKIPINKESGFKVSGEIDYTDLTYISESPAYFGKLTPEEKIKIESANKSIRDYYKGWEDKLKEIGWMEEPFPQSLITRNNKTIGNLKASLPRLKTDEARVKAEAEIIKLQDQNDRIKKQNIQFVSIPAKTILARADADPILRERIMSILPHWGRTTITVKDLVDTGIITRQEADARVIIGEYCDRMGRKYALGKIFENAEKEGLIKSAAEKPDWPTARISVKGQHVSIPQLRGKRLDPFFSDVITDFFSKEQVTLGGVFGVVKMMQFYNPLFMPMYDVWQSAAAGMAITPKAPKYMLQGIKDVWSKTDNWERASENGTFSKPFVIPYDKFEYKFKEAMKGNKLGDFLKKAALPTNWIPMLYSASWNTAWKLDETVRMMTFNMLQDQGYSDREAGQLAALYHSDYASVPPSTRKALNKVFFTPTFKITMGKLYLNMLKGAGKYMAKYPAKLIGKEIPISREEKNLARGAVIASSIMMGIKLYFESQGYEEQELFRKYVKTVETDEGPKENVITLANPFNIPWRYYYRVKGAFKPETTNVAEKMLQTVKWDLHPIWRVGADVVDNYNWNIYNPFDDSKKIATDIAIYTTGEFVAITKGILENAKEGEIKADAFKALQKDFGKFKAIIIKPFVFNYLREVKEKRKGWAINKLEKEFRLMMYVSPSKDPKENYKRLQNFNKRLQEIMTDFQ